MAGDPYRILEVDPGSSEAELRAAYRRAVQRHHPDHNGGSPESARRFEEVQEAWVQIQRVRTGGAGAGRTGGAGAARAGGANASGGGADPTAGDADFDARLRAMEQELGAARQAHEEAARAAREAAARARDARAADADRPSDEELGYIHTDDSIGKIFADAREQLIGGVHERSAADRAADALEELAARLRGQRKQ